MSAANHTPRVGGLGHNANVSPRAVSVVASGLGSAALATCVAVAWYVDAPGVLVPVALPVLWWTAGVLALAARPDHASARLLSASGLLHLVAFAVSALLSIAGANPAWAGWVAAVVTDVLFSLGFAAIATLLVTFPAERIRSSRAALVFAGAGVLVPVRASLTSPAVDLPLYVRAEHVRAPGPLPLGDHPLDLIGALPLIVVASLLVLAGRMWRAAGTARRQLLWPTAVAGVLALLLVATPAGEHLIGRAWALVFVPIVGALPFALLLGLLRFRLLEVELYAARTLAYAAVAATVVISFGAVAAVAGSRSPVAALVVAAAAAVLGHPMRVAIENRIDRMVSGGRVRGHALLRQLAESFEVFDPQVVAQRTASTIATGMEVAWVAVECSSEVSVHVGGDRLGRPAVCVPLVAGDQEVGTLTCGPRRGGWADDDVALVRLLGRHAALALHGADLTRALARRVAELTASRERLVRAEDDVRRRIERDLHDGIQQQLVVLLAKLAMLGTLVDPSSATGALAAQAHGQAQRSLTELRELARGIHPSVLSDRGIVAAVEAQVDVVPIPVTVEAHPALDGTRFAEEVEAAAYFVVCEATTNVLKHSGARRARVVLTHVDAGGLRVTVTDDGHGFVATAEGTGLRGLADRVEAVGGRLSVVSGHGAGTTVTAEFPVAVLSHG